MDLQELAKRAMERHGWSQAQLGKALGLSPGAIGKMARGDSTKTSYNVQVKLAQLAGVELSLSPDQERAELQSEGIPPSFMRLIRRLAHKLDSDQWEVAAAVLRTFERQSSGQAADKAADDTEHGDQEELDPPYQAISAVREPGSILVVAEVAPQYDAGAGDGEGRRVG